MIGPSALAILLTAALPAAFDATDWAWQCPVTTGADVPPGFVRISLRPGVIECTAPVLRDLRLVDDAGELVPYTVYRGRAAEDERIEWRDVRLIDRTFETGAYARVVLDFDTAVEKNRVRRTRCIDCCRNVSCPSAPVRCWIVLATASARVSAAATMPVY